MDTPATLLVDVNQPTQWGRDAFLMSSDRGRLLVRPVFCVERSCWCNKVELCIAQIDEHVARVIEHDEHVELGMTSGCTLRPPLGFDDPSAVLELQTGRFTALVPADGSEEELETAINELDQLGLRFDGAMLDVLWRWQSRARGAEPKPLTRRPPNGHRPGGVVGWHEVCSDARRDVLWHEREFVSCFDYYCPAPSCACHEVQLVFVGGKDRQIGTVWVRFKTDDLKFVLAEGSSRQQLDAVWRTYVERWPKYQLHLRERYHALRDALHDAVDVMPTEFTPSEAPQRNPPKIGRNQACPCGSGRKYKRCCGA